MNIRICGCGAVYFPEGTSPIYANNYGVPVGHSCPLSDETDEQTESRLKAKPAPVPRPTDGKGSFSDECDPVPHPEHLGRVEPMHRRNDKPTSVIAAETFDETRLTQLQTLVLEFFRTRKEATDEELEDALMGQIPAASTLRKRRCELVSLGYLRDSGRRRMNRNNREMVVWEITEEGAEEL
jgi:hypothetical protein